MSYCRKGDDSDVYMQKMLPGASASGKSVIECTGCSLAPSGFHTCQTPRAALAHLARHIRAGHKIPERTIERLKAEMQENEHEL